MNVDPPSPQECDAIRRAILDDTFARDAIQYAELTPETGRDVAWLVMALRRQADAMFGADVMACARAAIAA
jgi:cyanate lyase